MAKAHTKKIERKKIQRRTIPLRSGDVLVTQKMLSETKGELKSDITSVRLEVKALREEMNGRFAQVDARFTQMDSKISNMDAKLETVIAAIHRTNALVEEQNSRNRVVLDGYTSLYDHQVHTNKRLDAVEKIVFGKEQK